MAVGLGDVELKSHLGEKLLVKVIVTDIELPTSLSKNRFLHMNRILKNNWQIKKKRKKNKKQNMFESLRKSLKIKIQ